MKTRRRTRPQERTFWIALVFVALLSTYLLSSSDAPWQSSGGGAGAEEQDGAPGADTVVTAATAAVVAAAEASIQGRPSAAASAASRQPRGAPAPPPPPPPPPPPEARLASSRAAAAAAPAASAAAAGGAAEAALGEASGASTRCPRPAEATLAALTLPPRSAPPPRGAASLGGLLAGRKLAWCHDGRRKNGEFVLEADGTVGGDLAQWNLKRWTVSGKYQIRLDDGRGGNSHDLVFNCARTGFFVAQGGQRGYVEDRGFVSPDSAQAPTAPAAPDCSAYDAEPAEVREHFVDKRFAWCHDGHSKNGEFVLEAGKSVGGDFKRWNLRRWSARGPYEVAIDNGEGGNVHRLIFNCERTGFFVAHSAQRGYVEGRGFQSPDSAGAPSSATAPDCSVYDSGGVGARTPVWVWWDFPRGVPPYFRMNLRTWRRRISEDRFDLQLLNSSNIRRFLPGAPEGFFRLYPAAKSDFLRAGLLAVHGGVYLDGDMLLSHDLEEIVKDVLDGKVDFLPYEGPGDKCPESYTTNFMAAAKGNRLSSAWINATLTGMVQQCDLDESQNHREPVKVCCYQKDWCPRRECHVAWGDISRPPPVRTFPKDSIRIDCIPFRKGLAYTMSGEELYWTLSKEPTSKKRHCWPTGASDLTCSPPVGPLYGYFERHGHHLYNMLHGAEMGDGSDRRTDGDILKSNTVVAELYRRTLGIAKS